MFGQHLPFAKNLTELLQSIADNLGYSTVVVGGFPLIAGDVQTLVSSLNQWPHVTRLIIHGNHNIKTGMCWTCQLKYSKKHQHLSQLSVDDLRLIVQCEYIKYLDISNNNLGDGGAQILAQGSKFNEIHANNCGFTQEGADQFFSNLFITEIFLNGNLFCGSTDWSERLDQHLKRNQERSDPHLIEVHQQAQQQRELEQQVMTAIERNDIAELRRLIPQLPDGVNTKLEYGCSLLMYGVDKNKPQVLLFLLEHGALLEYADINDKTPLFTAAENGQSALVRVLLSAGSNITGEFYFNCETALSIAGFKVADQVNTLFRNLEQSDDLLRMNINQEELQRYRDYFQSLFNYNPPLWIAFGSEGKEDLRFDYVYQSLAYLKLIEEANLTNLRLTQARSYAAIYRLLHDKFCILTNRQAPLFNQALYQEKMLSDKGSVYRVTLLSAVPPSQSWTRLELGQQIRALNQQLSEKAQTQGITEPELEIDWSAYPQLWIAQYRGIHYYGTHFTPTQRFDHQSTRHLNRMGLAPAVYRMSGCLPNQHQLLRENRAGYHCQEVRDTVQHLQQTGAVTLFGQGERTNADLALQELMTNDYQGYRRAVEHPTNPHTQMLYAQDMIGYPHFATSDLPEHPLRYGFGKKLIEGLVPHRLLPHYTPEGKPLNRYLGKIFIVLMTPYTMAQHRVRHVVARHNAGQIHVKETIIYERETNVTGGVDADCMFYEECLEAPDFSQAYTPAFQEKFGLTPLQYEQYKQQFAQCRNSVERDSVWLRSKGPCLVDDVIRYKREQLLRIAQQEAAARGGCLIYRHDSFCYGLEPIPIKATPSSTSRLTHAEQGLMNTIGQERFARTPAMTATSPSSSAAPVHVQAAIVRPDRKRSIEREGSSTAKRRTPLAQANVAPTLWQLTPGKSEQDEDPSSAMGSSPTFFQRGAQ